MMKILYLDATRSLYGASRMMLTLLEEFVRLEGRENTGVKPLVVLANDVEDDMRLCRELDRLHIKNAEYPLAVLRRRKYLNPRGMLYLAHASFASVGFLRNLIREYKIDLVQTNTSTILVGALAARLCGVPHVWHVHEIFRKWEGRVLGRFIGALADCVVVPSHAVAQNLIEANPRIKRKLLVIPNGVDPRPFRSVSVGEVERLRSEWGIAPGEKVVGMAGRIGMWKGERQFVEVARRVILEHNVAVRFVVVGGVFAEEQWHLTELQSFVEQSGLAGRVLVAGLREDMPVVMNLFDMLLHLPTRPEPFGIVAIEAMSAGKPVVAASVGGLVEIVSPGETGFLVAPGDIEAAANYVVELLQDEELRTRMGQAGAERVDLLFSSAASAARFSRLYRQLLHRSS